MKVVTFGELMVRLQPFNYERFVQANSLEFTFGGGEANVAVSLANYGLDAAFVTKLPAHAIGQAAVNSLRRYGVDTSMITRGGDRVGIYYNEKGASQRGSVCIYDRANSAIQLAQPSDFDWEKIFEGVDWFHFTGITPALGENVVEICRQACKAAKAHGVKISCDLNYRRPESTAAEYKIPAAEVMPARSSELPLPAWKRIRSLDPATCFSSTQRYFPGSGRRSVQPVLPYRQALQKS